MKLFFVVFLSALLLCSACTRVVVKEQDLPKPIFPFEDNQQISLYKETLGGTTRMPVVLVNNIAISQQTRKTIRDEFNNDPAKFANLDLKSQQQIMMAYGFYKEEGRLKLLSYENWKAKLKAYLDKKSMNSLVDNLQGSQRSQEDL